MLSFLKKFVPSRLLPPPWSLTLEMLQKIYVNAPAERLEKYWEPLNEAMQEASINTPLRAAAFLAQIGHESAQLKYMSEIWGPTRQQLRYDPPSTLAEKLGNTEKGDGYRYRGAGPLEITGRNNFRAAGKALGIDLEGNPDLARTPKVGFQLACWYWNTRKLNGLADKKNFNAITYKINGGWNGKANRILLYKRALLVMGGQS